MADRGAGGLADVLEERERLLAGPLREPEVKWGRPIAPRGALMVEVARIVELGSFLPGAILGRTDTPIRLELLSSGPEDVAVQLLVKPVVVVNSLAEFWANLGG